jgi:hypothetical protein
MQDSKINFSHDEVNLINNQDFFKQKIIITKKMVSLFNELNDGIDKIKNRKENLPEPVKTTSGKISKGENYLGLPYLVLDNPRVFSNKNIFAFRTMFWWGNYFSFTFHLSGNYLNNYKRNIYRNCETLKGKEILICIHSEQWVHHLEKENYESIDSIDRKAIKKLIEEKGFLKLSRKLDLKKWNYVSDFGIETLKEYFSLLKL